MKRNCPKDGAHDGYTPLFVTVLQITATFPRVWRRKYRMCTHHSQAENFEHCIPNDWNCSDEQGLAFTWLQCEERKVLVKTKSRYLCQYHVHRIANAMRWIANPEASTIRLRQCEEEET